VRKTMKKTLTRKLREARSEIANLREMRTPTV